MHDGVYKDKMNGISRLWKISDKDYIEFRHGHSCYSMAGRRGQKQEIVLSPLCAEEHTLIHEVYFFIHQISELS